MDDVQSLRNWMEEEEKGEEKQERKIDVMKENTRDMLRGKGEKVWTSVTENASM